jgi:predicted  nucleic acid-binding Zn-ribbon protein
MFGLTSSRRVEDLQRRLDTLASVQASLALRLDELTATVGELDALPMEWEDWFEKFKSLYGRLNKRVQREEAKAAEVEPAAQAPPNPRALALLQPYQRSS